MSHQDSYFDSEEVMNWLLLNPELAEFEHSHIPLPQLLATNSSSSSSGAADKMDSFNFLQHGEFFDINEPSHQYSSSKDIKEEDRKAKYREKYIKSGKKREREVEDIEAKISKLKAENADLNAHVLNVAQRTTEIQKQRQEMEQLMNTKLEAMANDENADQTELAVLVKKFTDIYADYGRCRQKEVRTSHIILLSSLLINYLCRYLFM